MRKKVQKQYFCVTKKLILVFKILVRIFGMSSLFEICFNILLLMVLFKIYTYEQHQFILLFIKLHLAPPFIAAHVTHQQVLQALVIFSSAVLSRHQLATISRN